jgi:hypothetical protein
MPLACIATLWLVFLLCCSGATLGVAGVWHAKPVPRLCTGAGRFCTLVVLRLQFWTGGLRCPLSVVALWALSTHRYALKYKVFSREHGATVNCGSLKDRLTYGGRQLLA